MTYDEFAAKCDGPLNDDTALRAFYDELVATGLPVSEWGEYAMRVQSDPAVYADRVAGTPTRWTEAYNVASNFPGRHWKT